MITAEKVIQNLKEIADFCLENSCDESCPFYIARWSCTLEKLVYNSKNYTLNRPYNWAIGVETNEQE